ncbi:terminase small subunit [Ruminococcus difficilis]|uniref:Terminase small subunit n=1 Tax=Ruminococcus difficilis TaxID=2763069 RepID=A0A934WTG9_9FIRM|nr:terminase small subunit [Ruminococcus difficilis]
MTEKQKRFVDEYLIDLNATQAAIRAGYSKDTARAIGAENLTKPYIQQAIKERIEQLHNERSADAQEIIEYLTSVMRGESESEELVNEFIGDGCSRPTRVKKAPSEKDRIKAAELLGKRFGLFKDKVELDGSVKTDMATLAGVLDQLKGEDSAE